MDTVHETTNSELRFDPKKLVKKSEPKLLPIAHSQLAMGSHRSFWVREEGNRSEKSELGQFVRLHSGRYLCCVVGPEGVDEIITLCVLSVPRCHRL